MMFDDNDSYSYCFILVMFEMAGGSLVDPYHPGVALLSRSLSPRGSLRLNGSAKSSDLIMLAREMKRFQVHLQGGRGS